MSLELRPNCECCNVDLPPDAEAFICSFECTWCASCATSLSMKCLNCGGELVRRPVRPASKLMSSPPSTRRVTRAQPCP